IACDSVELPALMGKIYTGLDQAGESRMLSNYYIYNES
ncbi:MAG: hypothetical protein K0Q73_7127, partial [Paenibacillus sp.]|nr:hypothetical protein [Paenibacillus sp.]